MGRLRARHAPRGAREPAPPPRRPPSARAAERAGARGTHAFEPRELRALAERLPTELRYTLRLPIHLYTDSEVADALYVQDPASAEALALLGYAAARPDARGRVWVARSLALQAVRDWPTSVQFVHL